MSANHVDRPSHLPTPTGAPIGEFSIAFNPRIREPMMDTLFDEDHGLVPPSARTGVRGG
jgi:hypothetical protein